VGEEKTVEVSFNAQGSKKCRERYAARVHMSLGETVLHILKIVLQIC
jgi:hypothetical protein